VLLALDNRPIQASGTNGGAGLAIAPGAGREEYLSHDPDWTTYFIGCHTSKPILPRDHLTIGAAGGIHVAPLTVEALGPVYLLQRTGPASRPPDVTLGTAHHRADADAMVRRIRPQLLHVIPRMEQFFLADVTAQLERRVAEARQSLERP
jgi:hypothetical protein